MIQADDDVKVCEACSTIRSMATSTHAARYSSSYSSLALWAVLALSLSVFFFGCDGRRSSPAAPDRPASTATSAATEDHSGGPARPGAESEPPEIRQPGAAGSSSSPAFRIVSLSPAVTDILLDLGLGSFIVGRDAFDSQLDSSVPAVGDLFRFDAEGMIVLDPSDVVIQAGRRGAPPGLADLAERNGWTLTNLQIDGLEDIASAVRRLCHNLSFRGEESLRESVGHRADILIDAMRESLEPLPESDRRRLGSILLLYGLRPPSAFGPGSYLGDVLDRLGVRNRLTSGGPWQQMDLEALVALDPFAIVIVVTASADNRSSAERSTTTLDDDPATGALNTRSQVLADDLGPLLQLNISAVRAGRIVRFTHPQARLPGSSVIDVSRELRIILARLAATVDPESGP